MTPVFQDNNASILLLSVALPQNLVWLIAKTEWVLSNTITLCGIQAGLLKSSKGQSNFF